jgi:gamma-hexachlorocyclohexane dehydrochlorinase
VNQANLEALAERIDRVESKNAMRDLVTDYCRGFDQRDFERFLAIWSSDCIWDIGPPFGAFEGHSGITKAVKEILWPVWRETHHLTSNLKIQFENADSAFGECDVDCMGATRDDVVQMISATYKDHFIRSAGEWKIVRRDVKMHYFNPVPGAQMSAPA